MVWKPYFSRSRLWAFRARRQSGVVRGLTWPPTAHPLWALSAVRFMSCWQAVSDSGRRLYSGADPLQVCCGHSLWGMTSQCRLPWRLRWARVTQGVPSRLPSGVCTSSVGTVIITLQVNMYLVLMPVLTVLAGIFVLFIVSFPPIKGIFCWRECRNTGRYREENKSGPNPITCKQLLLTFRSFSSYISMSCLPLSSLSFFPSLLLFFFFLVST